MATLSAYLSSVQIARSASSSSSQAARGQGAGPRGGGNPGANAPLRDDGDGESGEAGDEDGTGMGENEGDPQGSTQSGFQERPNTQAKLVKPQIVNLMTVPGSQQVLLNVRIAELNRTALRQIGADILSQWGPGNVINTRIAGSATNSGAAGAAAALLGLTPGSGTTAFAIFPSGSFDIALSALRQNSVIRSWPNRI